MKKQPKVAPASPAACDPDIPFRYDCLEVQGRVCSDSPPGWVSGQLLEHMGLTHRLHLYGPGKNKASLNHCKAGCIDLGRVRYGNPVRLAFAALSDCYRVHLILDGECQVETEAIRFNLSAGEALVINAGESVELNCSEDCSQLIVRIPSSLFGEVCHEHHWVRNHRDIRFHPGVHAFGALEDFFDLLEFLCREAGRAAATQQMLHHFNHVLAGKLMTTLPHDVIRETGTEQSASFARLVQYIEDNIKSDITAEELAQQENISLRSLYLLFDKHARTTPKVYIRTRKLERVYSVLTDPASNVANITTVALEFGFTHLGRFSEVYKSSFGMLPSAALKERQGRGRLHTQ